MRIRYHPDGYWQIWVSPRDGRYGWYRHCDGEPEQGLWLVDVLGRRFNRPFTIESYQETQDERSS